MSTRQQDIYARVTAHPDYRRARADQDAAYTAMCAATDYDELGEATARMTAAGAEITRIYDTVIAEMRAEETP